MVTEKFQSIFKFVDAPVVHQNDAYHFCIKQLKPEGQHFQILYTEGLSDYSQPVDEKNKAYERIELYFLLPDYWDLAKKNWPISWLNRIAQVPQKNKTWFGVGDTLPAGNPPEELDELLACSYFILSSPLFLESYLKPIMPDNESFQLLAVIPIFAKEFEFKSQNSAKALLQIFKEKQIFEMIDLYRQPIARKKFMGLF